MKIKKIFFISVLLIYNTMFCFNSNAVKIVAYVNEDVITDYDVEEFESVLCKFDTRFECGSQNSKQMALYALIESVLKLEHFKQIDFGPDKQNIMKNFEEYKKHILKNMKISEKKAPKSFIDYLYSEYLWGMMISSQVRVEDITEEKLNTFIELHNIKMKDLDQIKQMYIQEKSNELSQKTMLELKKFYLVDVKGM